MAADGVVELEAWDHDDFDQHPCMGVVLRTIAHLHAKFGEKHRGSSKMPDWMANLHLTMENTATPTNVRLFLAKVVTRARTLFQPYAMSWFRPIVHAVLGDVTRSGGMRFHYLLRDICITILQWLQSGAMPSPPDPGIASRLVNHLMAVAAHDSRPVLSANIDVIRLFLHHWKDDLTVEKRVIVQYLRADVKSADPKAKSTGRLQRSVGLQLLGAVVVSGLPLYDSIRDSGVISEAELYRLLLENLDLSKDIYEAAGELLGMAVEVRRKTGGANRSELEAPLRSTIVKMLQQNEQDRFIYVLNKITFRCPTYIEAHVSLVADLLPRLHGIFRLLALDMLLRPYQPPPGESPSPIPMLFGMLYPSIPELLEHRDEQAQLRVLQLLSALLKDVPAEKIQESLLPKMCRVFSSHESPDLRLQFHRLLEWMYDEKDDMKGDPMVTEHLVRALCDSSDTLRTRAHAFWNRHLSSDVAGRLLELLNRLYIPAIEEHWAMFCNVLMLKLCADAPDFGRPIWDQPLSQCEFRDYTIDTSLSGPSLPMTPMFALSQAPGSQHPSSQTISTLSTLEGGPEADADGRRMGGARARPGMIRATMSPSLSLSQSTYSTQSGYVRSSSLMASPWGAGAGTQGSGPGQVRTGGPAYPSGEMEGLTAGQRRIPRWDQKRSQIIRSTFAARKRREVRAAQQAAERANKVHMMRHYRTGELPDIQIKHEEVILPLAAAAERDASLSRTLLRILFRAVHNLPTRRGRDTERDVNVPVRIAVRAAMDRTRGETAFVSALQGICLEDPEMELNLEAVGTASIKSRSFHAGALLLENRLLRMHPPQAAERPAKRFRAAGGGHAAPDDAEAEAWQELAKLYRALGEDDVVLEIFRRHVARRDKTKAALEAQIGGDPGRALRLYDEALAALDNLSDGGPSVSKVEEDLLYNQRLACMVDLGRWTDLVEDTLQQVTEDEGQEPDISALWQPKVRDPYLSIFVRSAVKVPAHRGTLSALVRGAEGDPLRRSALESEFGAQLAALAVMNDEPERARAHVAQCFRGFRVVWAALHPLALGARHMQVAELQKTVELSEMLQFVEDSSRLGGDNVPDSTPPESSSTPPSTGHSLGLEKLLLSWQARWPAWELDGPEVWDDILHSRLLFLDKIQSHLNGLLDRGRQFTDVASKDALASTINVQRARMYRNAAAGLRKRGDFDLASGYLSEYLANREGTAESHQFDFQFFKSLVKLRCLQAQRTRASGNDESATSMLLQVLDYVRSTISQPMMKEKEEWSRGCKLLLADAAGQLAWLLMDNALSRGAQGSTSSPPPAKIDQAASQLSEAFDTYQSIVQSTPSSSSGSHGVRLGGDRSQREAAKASLKFASFCDEALQLRQGRGGAAASPTVSSALEKSLPATRVLPVLVVRHLLKAISKDASPKAQPMVARVLSLMGQHPSTHKELENTLPHLPTWIFIPWIPQMLAVMDRPEGTILVKAITAIAKDYPQALYFPFRVSEEDFSDKARERTAGVASILKRTSPMLEGMVRALEDLTHPEHRLLDGLVQIQICIQRKNSRDAQAEFQRLLKDCLDVRALGQRGRQAGQYNAKFAQDWSKAVVAALGKDGGKLLSMDEAGFAVACGDTISKLKAAVQRIRSGADSLSKFSHWLADFDGSKSLTEADEDPRDEVAAEELEGRDDSPRDDRAWTAPVSGGVEVPGQYSGVLERPDPSQHVHVVGFDQTIQTMQSIRKPKILVMRGSDEREYKFVVKGGEDLRLDERVEQLFAVMNSLLRSDAACAKRRLQVRTYAVVPVSKRCGLLQFVEPTATLDGVLKDGLVACKLPREHMSMLMGEFFDFYQRKCGRKGQQNQEAAVKIPAADIERQLTSLHSKLPWDILRRGLFRLTTSAESQLAVRSQFLKSLAVVSICGYIAGVGDRHLNNSLIDLRNGTLIPIDFGYSFGSAQSLPVPEMVPFRLSRQFASVMLPLDTTALLRSDMVRVMTALHGSREVLSAVMDVFVKEPLLEWRMEAMKRVATTQKATLAGTGKARGEDESEEAKVLALHMEQQEIESKVEHAKQKLNLGNPTHILLQDLKPQHGSKPYFSALAEIARGDPQHNMRARVTGPVCSSVQQQVDCLIDQATDANLLGRLWQGWNPWV